MSDCGVCVSYGDSGGTECIGYRCVIVKAGQPWDCSECGKLIPKGEKYELASWFYADGDGHGNCKTCLICAEIADAFMCGGRWAFTELLGAHGRLVPETDHRLL